MVWVLRKSYKLPKNEIARTIYALLDAENVITDQGAVEAGLKTMQAGGDFADGVIAYEGRWLGGETFISFDKKAVSIVSESGQKAKLLV
jgi:predicted nucleic-acid-binding protein